MRATIHVGGPHHEQVSNSVSSFHLRKREKVEDEAQGGSSSHPTDPTIIDSVPPKNVAILLATTVQEEEAEAQRRAHLEHIAGKDWDRDFGGAFPDLMVGLAEGLAEMKRQEDEED